MTHQGNKKLKILHLHERSHIGGGNTFVHEMTKYLAEKGHTVYRLEGVEANQLNVNEGRARVKIVRFTVDNFRFLNFNPSLVAKTLKEFKKLSQEIKFDIIHLSLYSPSLLLLFFSGEFSKIPKVFHVYGAWYKEYQSSFSLPRERRKLQRQKMRIAFNLNRTILRIAQGFILSRVDKVIVLSSYEKKLILDDFPVGPEKISVIYGGVNKKIFHPLSEHERIRKKEALGFSRSTNILLLVSRLEPRKGLDNAIKAMPKILTKNPNSLLVVITPIGAFNYSEYLLYLYNLASELNLGGKVLFTTDREGEKLAEFYQAATCFIMASRDLETFGLTTIEALACGTPVLGTPTGATPEILKSLDERLLFESTKPNVITKKVNWLLDLSKKKYFSLRDNCAEYAKQFAWKRQLKELESIYKNLKV